METIQSVLGFVLGVIIFVIIFSKMKFFFISHATLVFIFMISLALCIIAAKLLSWLVIILVVIGAIIAIYCFFTSSPSEKGNEDEDADDGATQKNKQEGNS